MLERLEKVQEAFAQGRYEEAARACFPLPGGLMKDNQAWASCCELVAQIPPEIQKSSVHCCLLLALNGLYTGNPAELRHWQSALVALRDATRESTPQREQLDYAVTWLTTQTPKEDNGQLLLALAILYNAMLGKVEPYGWLCPTSGGPSVLRGTKDLSEWGKNHRAVNSIIKPMLGKLMEDGGRGVCEAAAAELFYEKNRLNEASLQVALAVTSRSPGVRFAGLAQLARINRFDPAARPPAEILEDAAALLEGEPQSCLHRNYQAVRVRFAIDEGDLDTVRTWLEGEDVPLGSYNPANLFRLITKGRALMALGRCRDAATLFEQLVLMMERDFRPLDTAECLINGAAACQLLGAPELAQEKLERALTITRPYGYIRVYADVGAELLPVLEALDATGDDYVQHILAATREFAELCPTLYRQPEPTPPVPPLVEALTPTELTILKQIQAGHTNNEIASAMNTKVTTVKFHIKNIFGKLGAKNRTEAVNLALQHGLLD